MSRRQYQDEINQIESISNTKGIDIDDIVVEEETTEDGDDLIVFRVLETNAESEEDSVGIQVSKMPSVQGADMTFRNDVQRKMNSLKKYLAGDEGEVQNLDENTDTSDDTSDDVDPDRETPVQRDTRTRDGDTSGPGAEIDARLTAVEARMDELEDRVEEYEDALDALQQLTGGG